jgi:hypothetical protein
MATSTRTHSIRPAISDIWTHPPDPRLAMLLFERRHPEIFSKMADRRTKNFPTGDVITMMTGVIVSENIMAGFYQVAAWMTGENVTSHQLPRISREAVPVMLALHPHLAPVMEEVRQVNPENWRKWLETWTDRYGDEIAVPVMTIAEHERIDPASELAEKVPPHKILNYGGKS